ncbi:MAG: hypothetical protein HOJ35_11140 [Bdellovibrionales bacterium]|jgi:hypothetical protein|nr:hypothetical protein [Bdellovibrionales bacterium]
MQQDQETYTRNLLVLLKLDSENLYKSINERFDDYMKIFALKRTRDHFAVIFRSRYLNIPLVDLANCSEDVILALNSFYEKASELHWYLMSTEDMPAMVEDVVRQHLRGITPIYETLKLYLTGELSHISPDEDLAHQEINRL